MSKVISIFNQKGGVGKTTTAINLATGLGQLQQKVLLIDLDPQGNASSGLGVDPADQGLTIYQAMIGESDINLCIRQTPSENVALIPSDSNLSGLEVELVSMPNRNTVLKKTLEQVKEEFDFIFIDCPPSLGLLSLNALTSSHSVIIPIQCEYYALEGVSQVLETMNLVKKHLNPQLSIEGIVLTMFDGRNKLSIEVVEEVKQFFKDRVFSTLVPRNIRLAEAPSYGMSAIEYDPRAKGSKAYIKLAEELLEQTQGSVHKSEWIVPGLFDGVVSDQDLHTGKASMIEEEMKRKEEKSSKSEEIHKENLQIEIKNTDEKAREDEHET